MSINDLFKVKKDLTKELAQITREFEKKKSDILSKIETQNELIENYDKMDSKAADGAQLVSRFYVSKQATPGQVKALLNYAIRSIKDGELIDVLNAPENYSYWYNSGFSSGHARRMELYYGENYAVERVRIQFSPDLYERKEVTSDETLAILAYLNELLANVEG